MLLWALVEYRGVAIRADTLGPPDFQVYFLESPRLSVNADRDIAVQPLVLGESLKRVDSPAREKMANEVGGVQLLPKQVAASNTDFDTYWARPYLSVAPTARTDVIVVPPHLGGIVPVVLHLTLYIDEAGRVRRVRNDTPGIPSEYVEAATRAFRVAEFRPGEIEGQAVKSLLQVDVTFAPGGTKEPRPK